MFKHLENSIGMAAAILVTVLIVFVVREVHQSLSTPQYETAICTTDSECARLFGGYGDPEPIEE
jgi:hypothetical protein